MVAETDRSPRLLLASGYIAGANADLLGLVPIAIVTVLLYLVGREVLLKPRPASGPK